MKDALWGGGGTHRSWPGGRGVDQGPWLQERVRGDGSSKEGGGLGLGWLFQRGASPGKGSGKGWLGGRGGCKGFGCGGVGGRGSPRDGANLATCVVFLSFLRRKMAFFEGCPSGKGWLGRKAGHPPTELAWWTGGQGGGARARGGVQGLRFGGVGGETHDLGLGA